MEIISLQECLRQIHTGKPFDITFVTADMQRKTGGVIKIYQNCTLSQKSGGKQRNGKGKNWIVPPKAPHHYENATRNIRLPNGDIRKIHIRLITEFNGFKVVY